MVITRWVVTTEVVDGATCSNDFSRLPGGSAAGSAACSNDFSRLPGGSATCSNDFSRLPDGQAVGGDNRSR